MGKSNPVVTSTSDGLAIEVFLTFPFGLARKALYSTLSPSGYHAAVSNADDTVISVVTTLVSSTIIRSFLFVLSASKTLVPSGENVTELGEPNEADVPVLSESPEDPVPANVLTTALPVDKSTRRTLKPVFSPTTTSFPFGCMSTETGPSRPTDELGLSAPEAVHEVLVHEFPTIVLTAY
jgi:hypothetical protein